MWCCSSSELFVAVVLLPGWICSGFQLQATARILLYCGGFCVAFECMCGNPLYYIYVHGFSCCIFVHVASAFFAREYYGKYACKCCIPMHSQCGWSCACVSRRLFLPGHRKFVISKNHVCYYRGEICEHYRSRQSNRTTVPKAWIYVNSAKNVTCKPTQNFIEHATLYLYTLLHAPCARFCVTLTPFSHFFLLCSREFHVHSPCNPHKAQNLSESSPSAAKHFKHDVQSVVPSLGVFDIMLKLRVGDGSGMETWAEWKVESY